MASKVRTLPIRTPAPGQLTPLPSKISAMLERNSPNILEREFAPSYTSDLILYHNAADETWCNQLAKRIRSERSGFRHFITHHACWNFTCATDILLEAEKGLLTSRLFGLVVSARM